MPNSSEFVAGLQQGFATKHHCNFAVVLFLLNRNQARSLS